MPVLQGGKVVGIVSRTDIVRAMAGLAPASREGGKLVGADPADEDVAGAGGRSSPTPSAGTAGAGRTDLPLAGR